MQYTTKKIRRQDRILEEKSALLLLKEGEYGVLSVQRETSGGYGIPVNYVWNEESSIYLHCAPQGRKLKCIDFCDIVSFCIIGRTKVIPEKFTTNYESIILDCVAVRNLEEKERMKALEQLVNKYAPNEKMTGMKYIEKSFYRTEIIRLDIVEFSGKTKSVKG